jgi:hypothetical protein
MKALLVSLLLLGCSAQARPKKIEPVDVLAPPARGLVPGARILSLDSDSRAMAVEADYIQVRLNEMFTSLVKKFNDDNKSLIEHQKELLKRLAVPEDARFTVLLDSNEMIYVPTVTHKNEPPPAIARLPE